MTITKMYEGAWSLDEGGVRFFLIEGTERAMLIDTGMQTPNAKELALKILEEEGHGDKPLSLINTHCDRDHTNGNSAFEEFYLHPAETVNYFKNGGKGKILPVYDKDIIELGDHPLEIIALPGHTPGSIGILDVNAKVLYGGDGVQDGNIFMFGPMREMNAYILGLERLETMSDKFDCVYPSHGTIPVEPSIISALKDGAKKILAGELIGEEFERFGMKGVRYNVGVAGFLCEK